MIDGEKEKEKERGEKVAEGVWQGGCVINMSWCKVGKMTFSVCASIIAQLVSH